MKVNVYTKNNIGVLEISAQILGDTETPNLQVQVKDLIAKGINNVILDLAAVRLINSIGIGNIMVCLTSVKKAGGQLKLAAVTEKIIGILALMEIDQLIEIYEDIESALASYQSDS